MQRALVRSGRRSSKCGDRIHHEMRDDIDPEIPTPQVSEREYQAGDGDDDRMACSPYRKMSGREHGARDERRGGFAAGEKTTPRRAIRRSDVKAKDLATGHGDFRARESPRSPDADVRIRGRGVVQQSIDFNCSLRIGQTLRCARRCRRPLSDQPLHDRCANTRGHTVRCADVGLNDSVVAGDLRMQKLSDRPIRRLRGCERIQISVHIAHTSILLDQQCQHAGKTG